MTFALDRRWTVGGGIRFHAQILAFLDFVRDSYGLEGGILASVYDSHPGLRWDGGRILPAAGHSVMESVRRVRDYNARGIGFNITFSNVFVEPGHLGDIDCNRFLELCESPLNGVIVSSPRLAEHVRRRFGAYKLIGSIGHNRRDEDFLVRASRDFDVVVLHPDLNRNHDLIRKLDTGKLEILVNECCVSNCPFRKEHSEFIARLLIDGAQYVFDDTPYTNTSCRARAEGYPLRDQLVLSFAEVAELTALGVRRFKIQGREHPFEALVQPALRRYVLKDLNASLAARAGWVS